MVGDLGLGKTVDMSSRLTMIAGTPTFVAPEQAQGERIDARADQYSLAALTYLLLTGRPPRLHATLAAAASPGEPDPMSTPEWPCRPTSRPSSAAASPPTATTGGPTSPPSPRLSRRRPAAARVRPAPHGCCRSTRSAPSPEPDPRR